MATRLILIGGYTPDTGGTGSGVTVVRADPGGGLTELAATPASGPSFLARHPRLPVLYAVGESEEGTVACFDRGPGGALAEAGRRPTGGSYPCHVAVDPRGRWLVVANYGDGTLSAHRLDAQGRPGEPEPFRHTGSGPDPARQEGPHAHQAVFGPDGTLYQSDLGTDEIRRYLVADEITLHPDGPVRLAPGMGPRHFARSGGHWYVTGELDGTVAVYDDSWTELNRVRASSSAAENAPSHLEASADGRYVYVANRGPDTVTVLSAPGLERVAEVSCGGDWPRHFAILGDHMYVACQRSDEVTALPLADGVPTAPAATFATGSPSCVLPVPDF
ncbi:hypothetical protein Misp01_72100 [Microtetraspora sp. NBRC 13810]|uniref:lactonase family protein n=1 Tax=Microtetraspora sp. NBRC 13810 TaxID=3030990 RepID=UPI0024A53E86|nr:lactonase family protein [Microtetraspora sp. NBRC 13810]GLW12082.1 hypothetical protein Misp01_72100 [Microtetraspora sp. NBRC 13810]